MWQGINFETVVNKQSHSRQSTAMRSLICMSHPCLSGPQIQLSEQEKSVVHVQFYDTV